MQKLISNDKGFSYTEILIATMLLALVFSSAFYVYQQGITVSDKGNEEIELQQSLRIALDQISKDLRGTISGEFRSSANNIVVEPFPGYLEKDSFGNLKPKLKNVYPTYLTQANFKANESANVVMNDDSVTFYVYKIVPEDLVDKIAYKKRAFTLLKNNNPLSENISKIELSFDLKNYRDPNFPNDPTKDKKIVSAVTVKVFGHLNSSNSELQTKIYLRIN